MFCIAVTVEPPAFDTASGMKSIPSPSVKPFCSNNPTAWFVKSKVPATSVKGLKFAALALALSNAL